MINVVTHNFTLILAYKITILKYNIYYFHFSVRNTPGATCTVVDFSKPSEEYAATKNRYVLNIIQLNN